MASLLEALTTVRHNYAEIVEMRTKHVAECARGMWPKYAARYRHELMHARRKVQLATISISRHTKVFDVPSEVMKHTAVGSIGYVNEVYSKNDLDSLPEFPEKCPVCGATIDSSIDDTNGPSAFCVYMCGSEYTWKSQIQNHTNKWWFSGPCKKKS